MSYFHECELKFYFKNEKELDSLVSLCEKHGYIFNKNVVETDYIFDTKSKKLKRTKTLLRLRLSETIDCQEILLTLKTTGPADDFQDCIEYEISSSNMQQSNLESIIEITKEKTGALLPEDILRTSNLEDIVKTFIEVGLFPVSVLQKKRKEFVGNTAKILFDKFPVIDGFFVEFESDSKEKLFQSIRELGINTSSADKRNYGQIIASLTNNKTILVF